MVSQKLLIIVTLLSILFLIHPSHSITFTVRNNCPYTVWPAAVPIGGGRQLSTGQTWTFNTDHHLAHIWARTNCSFNSAGRGSCLTGDCNGQLACRTIGSPPHTRADYGLNTFNHQDYYTVSVMQGFNVPIEFAPLSNGCTRSISCRADLTTQCPSQLRAPGGCNNPCTVYGTTQYCCHSGACRPTDLSRFFKARCRDAFTFPEDDPTSTFLCPAGTNYRVTFCP